MSREINCTKYAILDSVMHTLKRLKKRKKKKNEIIEIRGIIETMVDLRSYSWIDDDCRLIVNYCDDEADFPDMRSLRKEFGSCDIKAIAHWHVSEMIFEDPFIKYLLETLENKEITPEQVKSILSKVGNEFYKMKRKDETLDYL
jgi:hypothetical protein